IFGRIISMMSGEQKTGSVGRKHPPRKKSEDQKLLSKPHGLSCIYPFVNLYNPGKMETRKIGTFSFPIFLNLLGGFNSREISWLDGTQWVRHGNWGQFTIHCEVVGIENRS